MYGRLNPKSKAFDYFIAALETKAHQDLIRKQKQERLKNNENN
jgi:hypothetical protein